MSPGQHMLLCGGLFLSGFSLFIVGAVRLASAWLRGTLFESISRSEARRSLTMSERKPADVVPIRRVQ